MFKSKTDLHFPTFPLMTDIDLDLPAAEAVSFASNSSEVSGMDLHFPTFPLMTDIDLDVPAAEAVSFASNSSEVSGMDLHFATFPVMTDIDLDLPAAEAVSFASYSSEVSGMGIIEDTEVILDSVTDITEIRTVTEIEVISDDLSYSIVKSSKRIIRRTTEIIFSYSSSSDEDEADDSHVQNINQDNPNDVNTPTSYNDVHRKLKLCTELGISSKKMEKSKKFGLKNRNDITKLASGNKTVRKRKANAECSITIKEDQNKNQNYTNDVGIKTSNEAVQKTEVYPECSTSSKRMKNHPRISSFKNTNGAKSTLSDRTLRKRNASADCSVMMNRITKQVKSDSNTNNVMPTSSKAAVRKINTRTDCTVMSKKEEKQPVQSDTKNNLVSTSSIQAARKRKLSSECTTSKKLKIPGKSGFKNTNDVLKPTSPNQAVIKLSKKMKNEARNYNLKSGVRSDKMNTNTSSYSFRKKNKTGNSCLCCENSVKSIHTKHCHAIKKNPVVMLKRLDPSTIENLKSRCTYYSNGIEKKNKRCQNINIMFTGDNFDAEHKIAESLGAEIVDNFENCSHLVAKEVKRTTKFLCCIGSGIPILSTQWLLESQKVGRVVDYNPFILKDKKSEELYKYNLEKTLCQAKEKPLFSGYNFYISGVVQPSNEDLRRIIKCSGGTILKNLPSGRIENVVIIADEDVLKNDPFMRSKIQRSIVMHKSKLESSEFVLAGLLQYKINFKKYRITC